MAIWVTTNAGSRKQHHNHDRKVWLRHLAMPLLQKGETGTVVCSGCQRQQKGGAQGIDLSIGWMVLSVSFW